MTDPRRNGPGVAGGGEANTRLVKKNTFAGLKQKQKSQPQNNFLQR